MITRNSMVHSIFQNFISYLTRTDSAQQARDRFSLEPWKFDKNANRYERAKQNEYQEKLVAEMKMNIGEGVYISPEAAITGNRLVMGNNSAVGANCQIGMDVEIGHRCTINPGSVVRGHVRIGDDVRISSGAQVLGFNHCWDDLERPIWKQPLSFKGVEIGDDVWIGANALVLDGVRIGSHSIVGAGTTVTKDVKDWMIVAGNPAAPIRSRKYGRLQEYVDMRADWERFVSVARKQIPKILATSFSDGVYYDFSGDRPKVRALTDAVELAAMADCDVPGFTRSELIETLISWQDDKTGLVPGPFNEERFDSTSPRAAVLDFGRSAYAVMATGYALECLGSKLRRPIQVAHEMSAAVLAKKLDSLPWATHAWQCGAWIDHFATACHFNTQHHELERDMSDLHEWLNLSVDPESGLWGSRTPKEGLLQPVNGFYRLTRGAHGQFGWKIEDPNRVVDSVLTHAHDQRHISETTATACNVLDVVHPLYLCGLQTDYRSEDTKAVAHFWLQRTIDHWQPNEGMRFELAEGKSARLQGTEMWLAIGWLCAHVLGLAHADDTFRPKGIHRL